MFIPQGKTEQEVCDTITLVAKRLASKYKFGYYDEEDIIQEAFIIVIESGCLEKYDPERPLENFLSRHLRNRLYNLKRNKYIKPSPPCARCPIAAFLPPNGCSAYKERSDCQLFKKWETHNESRRNIMNAIPIYNVKDLEESTMNLDDTLADDMDNEYNHHLILANLTQEERKLYLMYLENYPLSETKINKLLDRIEEIV